MGLPYACVCPPAELDWRPIVHEVVSELEDARARIYELGKELHESEKERGKLIVKLRDAESEARTAWSSAENSADVEGRLSRLEARFQTFLDTHNLWDGS